MFNNLFCHSAVHIVFHNIDCIYMSNPIEYNLLISFVVLFDKNTFLLQDLFTMEVNNLLDNSWCSIWKQDNPWNSGI